MSANDGWYDRLYADDPSTDNVFGREDLTCRPVPTLQAFLAASGRLEDHVPRPDPAAPARLAALMDRLIAPLLVRKTP